MISLSLRHFVACGPAAFIGRALAACVHPYAAWRVLPRSSRVVVVSAYAALAYFAVLGSLLFR